MRLIKDFLCSFIHANFTYQLVNFRKLIFFVWEIRIIFAFQIHNVNLIKNLKRFSFVAGDRWQKWIQIFFNILRFFFNLLGSPDIKVNRAPSHFFKSCQSVIMNLPFLLYVLGGGFLPINFTFIVNLDRIFRIILSWLAIWFTWIWYFKIQ